MTSGWVAPAPYPGTEQHQALQAALVDFYADDPRALCVAVFGSLGPNFAFMMEPCSGTRPRRAALSCISMGHRWRAALARAALLDVGGTLWPDRLTAHLSEEPSL